MKKKIFISIGIVIVLASIIGIVIFGNKLSNKNNYSLEEQQWIENNKNNVVDMYIPSDIAIFSNMGEGLLFDFVSFLETDTGLTINTTAYKISNEMNGNYGIELVDNVDTNQIEVFEDNYVLVSTDNKIYTETSELSGITIGVLNTDYDLTSKYLDNDNIEYKTYETSEDVLNALVSEEVDAISVLRTIHLDEIMTNNWHIVYHITEMSKKYALTLDGEETLNNIIKKAYNKWELNNYDISYNNHLLDVYFSYKNISEKEKTNLREKTYMYGFVKDGAYDSIKSSSLVGINYYIIKSFAKFANIDMNYKSEYNNIGLLMDDFNNNEIDFVFGNTNYAYGEKFYQTVAPIPAKVVILTNVNEFNDINSINSLQGKKVAVVNGSKIESYLTSMEIEVNTYDNVHELVSKSSKDEIIVIDLENYEYYKTNKLANFKISYTFNISDNYNYVINGSNEVFMNLFDFYLEYTPIKNIVVESYSEIYNVEVKTHNYLLFAVILLSIIVLLEFIGHIKKLIKYIKVKTRKSLSKDEKIKYIDRLTSLKNRTYLNDNIEKWDNSEVYPQALIVIDLNNIAYINDNFGHEEGDKVITEAANILIRTQMPRTEIIRSDGNEFLIYMISYDEKQAAAYLRKLTKEFKELSHGFGAALGYSVITDGIKTIDDAVNEATLDMKTNKEAMLED